MLTLQQCVRPNPDVVDTELDGSETVLLHLQSKLYYTLNSTGTRIWRYLKSGLALAEISDKLQQEFSVDAATADRSVIQLVDELWNHKLVQHLSSEPTDG